MKTNELVKLAIDAHKGHIAGSYAVDESMEVLRQALVEANGGSTKLDYRSIRDGKCNGVFSIVEEIINKTVIEGLPDSCPLFQFVDFRNLKEGDSNVFELRDNGIFIVADIAQGTQGLRRQRLAGGEEIAVKTQLKGIKIYEEMRRVLSGRIDFNELIDKVAEAFQKQINDDIYAATKAAFAGLVSPYKDAGTWDEEKVAKIIDHVEAATGMKATILCSKQAARKITSVKGSDADAAKNDLYNMGYYGKFYTTPIIVMENGHVPGTDKFILEDDLYIVASEDKFVKFVTEGDTLIVPTESTANADLSQEYLMAMSYGMKIAFAAQFGVFCLS